MAFKFTHEMRKPKQNLLGNASSVSGKIENLVKTLKAKEAELAKASALKYPNTDKIELLHNIIANLKASILKLNPQYSFDAIKKKTNTKSK